MWLVLVIMEQEQQGHPVSIPQIPKGQHNGWPKKTVHEDRDPDVPRKGKGGCCFSLLRCSSPATSNNVPR
jgi:hypothetical protein